jgi:hypothetical protein
MRLLLPPRTTPSGIQCAAHGPMLLTGILIWAALAVAVCAVCAAGGRADERTERSYEELNKRKESAAGEKQGAA